MSLLILRTVSGLQCYLTDDDHLGLNIQTCSDSQTGCTAFAIKVSYHPNEVIRGRACTDVGPSDPTYKIEQYVCQKSAEKLSATHCSVVFCFFNLCNEYADLDPKPIPNYGGSSGPGYGGPSRYPSRVTITRPYNALILCALIFYAIQ